MDAQQLSEQRWQQIQTILDEVFDLPTEARLPSAQLACEGDPVLYQEVATLLKAEADAPGFLERPALELAQSLLATSTSGQHAPILDYSNRCVGAYRLREEIGRGGMGVVYRAERADGSFDQQVAIKLLWNWQDREMRLDRFQREQQLLASLNHPNIAQLFDGGLTEEGQPYIVMEYVQGQLINRYCDHHQLTINARLRLILQVVDALHYAHRNLVIHRDIKPSNILVTEDGQIKLLDFGIAKLVDDQIKAESPAALNLTQTGEHLMTPGFAAPEQFLGQKVTVATDIFQLGLVLYELLTECQAFREGADSFYELARNICETTPTRPSVVVSQLARNSTAATQHKHLNEPPGTIGRLSAARLTQWRKKLGGDLDAIVLKALRNEPDKRYTSMEALRSDIHAYFAARPVAAYEKGVRYRLGKFVRRNTFAVGASSTIGVLLIVYAATVTVQAHRIQNALEQSRVEAHKAQQVTDFIIDIFKVSDPNVSGIETVTARELLEKGRDRVRDELADAPENQAQMLYALGEIYYSLGSYKESASLLDGALRVRQDLLPEHDPLLAATQIRLGLAYNSMDKQEAAHTLFEKALATYELLGVDSVEKGEALNSMGSVARKLGDYSQARQYFEQAISLLRNVEDGKHYELALAINNLAALQVLQGELVTAVTNMRETVALLESILGPEHSYFSLSLKNLAEILIRLGQYEEAGPLQQRALRIQQKTLGPNHPYVAYTLWSLGNLAHREGRLEEAERYLRRALRIHETVHGRHSIAVASSLSRLGPVLQDQGRTVEAHSALTEALQTDLAIRPAGHPMLGRDYYELAALAHAANDRATARAHYEKALQILPPSSPTAAAAKLGYARLLLDSRELRAAVKNARSALAIFRSTLPAGHSNIAEAQSVLNSILRLQVNGTQAASTINF